MFIVKVKDQGHSSQRKVLYQQQKHYNMAVQQLQTWHGVVIKAKKDWHGSCGLESQLMHSQLPRFLVLIFIINLLIFITEL